MPAKTHGMTRANGKKTPTYTCWRSMRHRCNNPKAQEYRRYGERGIKVCKRWDKFENFLEDMGVKPDGMSIERVDTNKGYSKSNCTWATPRAQQRNKRNNVYLTYKGEKKLLCEWAPLLGLSANVLYLRIYNGWTIERAFTTPPMR